MTSSAVHLVHQREQPLRLLPLVGAQAIEDLPAQLARGLGHAVEVGLDVDPELGGGGQRVVRHERQGQVGLGEFLLGVLEEPAVAHVVVPGEHVLRLGQVRGCLRDQRTRFAELSPVHRADRRRARADARAATPRA